MSELKRRGDVAKCPVCGSAVDPEAYHCPKCRNYFCYHCRARLLGADTQLQCANQGCDYYGKLICGECDSGVEHEEPPSVYAEPEDGYWPLWLIVSLIVGAVAWWFTSFLGGAAIAAAVYLGGGYGLQRLGWNIFGAERKVTQQRTVLLRSCLSCKQAVKEIRGR